MRKLFSLQGWLKKILMVVLLFSMVACVSIPAQQMSDARQAMQAADEVAADEKAPDEYRKAQQLLEQADQHLKQGNYGEAKALAVEAKQAALNARLKAMQGSFGR